MPTINTWISDDDYNEYLVVKQKGKGAWTGFIHSALAKEKGLPPEVQEQQKKKTVVVPIGETLVPGIIKPPKIIKTGLDAMKAVEQLNCKGGHFMSRKDCGKEGCPWKGIT